jgi:hypothetical protein
MARKLKLQLIQNHLSYKNEYVYCCLNCVYQKWNFFAREKYLFTILANIIKYIVCESSCSSRHAYRQSLPAISPTFLHLPRVIYVIYLYICYIFISHYIVLHMQLAYR